MSTKVEKEVINNLLKAKSIFLGGDIVTAKECNYDSYKKLGLVCPFCNEPVFLRRSHERQSISIPDSFCHFRKDSLSEACELRSLSNQGKEELEKLATEAKNQRHKLFKNHLWGIIKQHLKFPEIVLSETKNYRKTIGAKEEKQYQKLFLEIISLPQNLSSLQEQENLAKNDSKQHYLHYKIYVEVLEYLATDSGRYCAINLLFCQLTIILAKNNLKEGIAPWKAAIHQSLERLYQIPWVDIVSKT